MTARKKSHKPGTKELSFEAAISELEEIVAAMEEEELPLEELVARFEQGTQLLARCQTVLDSAKKRLQTIATSPDPENNSANPLTQSESPTTELPDDDDDIRLF
ncbi:MAG: exodeoxyribonuclease VII small subunit [Verrucomicrobiales bacterium]